MNDGYLKTSDIRADGLTKMNKFKERQRICGGPDDRPLSDNMMRAVERTLKAGNRADMNPIGGMGRTFHALYKRGYLRKIEGTDRSYEFTQAAIDKFNEQMKARDFLTR